MSATTIIGWRDPGQNRESGGRKAEGTGYATGDEASESKGSGPVR